MQAVSAKLFELTQAARREEELHLVAVKRKSQHQQLVASSGNLEGAAAEAVAAVGPRAALAVIAEHLMSTCTFVAAQAAETISGQNRHPLLTQPPAKKRKRPPSSKDKHTPDAVQVKTEVKAEEIEVKAEETKVKAEDSEVKAEETALQPLSPRLEEAVAVTAVSEVFVNTPGRRISACIGQLPLYAELHAACFVLHYSKMLGELLLGKGVAIWTVIPYDDQQILCNAAPCRPMGDPSYAKHHGSPSIVSYTGNMLQQLSSVVVMPDEQS